MAHYNGSTDKETIAHLKEINAELLTALEKLYDACAPYEHLDVVVGDACDTATAVMTKASGYTKQKKSNQ